MIRLSAICALLLYNVSIYTYNLPGNNTEDEIHLSEYQGKKILLVNTASNSGYSMQYQSLEQLHQLYKDSLVIIAVPSNSFNNEPFDDSTISAYLNANYPATYIIAGKSEIIGDSAIPLYQWLVDQSLNGQVNNEIKGDFQKFLIDNTGKLVGVFAPSVDPMSDELLDAINGTDD